MDKTDLVVKSNRLNMAIQNLTLPEIRLIQLSIVDARETGTGLNTDTLYALMLCDTLKHLTLRAKTPIYALEKLKKRYLIADLPLLIKITR